MLVTKDSPVPQLELFIPHTRRAQGLSLNAENECRLLRARVKALEGSSPSYVYVRPHFTSFAVSTGVPIWPGCLNFRRAASSA